MKHRVRKALQKHLPDHPVTLDRPKDSSFGHFATNAAFLMAKERRQSPHLIAKDLEILFGAEEIFERVEAVSGFVNFKLKCEFLNLLADEALADEAAFGRPSHHDGVHETILLEYVSANPTGPLHIGHARGALFGDTLARIGRHLGHKITTEYYINDAGRQVWLLGLSLWLKGREEILNIEVKWPEEFYRGEYITDLAWEAQKALGSGVFEEEEGISTLSVWGKDQMMALIRQNLADVGIVFDRYVSEKETFKRWHEVQALLDRHSALYETEGKIWLATSQKGDEKDRVVVRENGEPTYLAGDIVYHEEKFKQGFDRYINIWGADHHGYIARVKAAVAFLGYDSDKLEVLLSQMVRLLKGGEPYKMSKRAGNFVLMSEVVEEIGADALRFIFLTKKPDTHLEFDLDDLTKEDSSNPIFYINYAHARVHSLVAKSGRSVEEIKAARFTTLDDQGLDLLFSALSLGEALEDAWRRREMQSVADYLYTLASKLHKFYYDHKILGTDNELEYLKLFWVAGLSIRQGLALVGITAKERM